MLQSGAKMPTEEDFQVRLHVDQYRAHEILFDPSIIGVEQAGISEILANIFKNCTHEQR